MLLLIFGFVCYYASSIYLHSFVCDAEMKTLQLHVHGDKGHSKKQKPHEKSSTAPSTTLMVKSELIPEVSRPKQPHSDEALVTEGKPVLVI